jgi:uncharacterized membrane protein YphA (DoxX/SURF4 family)
MENIMTKTGRLLFAAGIACIGVQQLIYGDFRPVVLPLWPAWLPGHIVLAYLVAIVLLVAGLAILTGIKARQAAGFLAILFLLLLLLFHLPFQWSHNLYFLGAWGDAFKALALSGGAFAVAGSLSPDHKTFPLARVFFSITMIVFGYEHFLYAPFVDMLVPAWMPGHRFWTYFCGIALMAAGIAIILKIRMRMVATLLGVMIFCWFIMVHIPRAIADPSGQNGNEWTSVFEALAFSGISFVLAGESSEPVGSSGSFGSSGIKSRETVRRESGVNQE